MNQYLLSVHDSPGSDCQSRPKEEMQEAFACIEACEKEMKSGGAWLFSGRLTPSTSATVVRDNNGKVVTTDGPFLESKEHLAGFYVINATDLDAALKWAKKVTVAVGAPIEVRPFWGFEGN